MSATTALRLAVLGLAAAVTVIAFTGPARSAADAAAGSRIVFHSRLKGGNNEIFSVNANGTGLTRLTRSTASDSNPTWSPDGKRVAFESNRHGDRRGYQDSDVFVMNANGTRRPRADVLEPLRRRPRLVAAERDRVRERAQRRRRRLLDPRRRQRRAPPHCLAGVRRRPGLVAERQADRLHERARRRRPRGVCDERRRDRPGAPDDERRHRREPVLVAERPRDRVRLAARRQPRGLRHERRRHGVRRVTDHPAIDAIPAWSQDGTRIVFVSERIAKGQRRLFSVSANGGAARQLTRGAYDMSPDWYRG